MEFTYIKKKRKLALTHKQKIVVKVFSTVGDDWMKMIFRYKSRICISQDNDAGIFVWCYSN